MLQSIKEVLPAVLAGIENPAAFKRQELAENWAEIIGPKWAEHTKPKLRTDGTLCVWTDQSVLAFELNQKYRRSILKRAQARAGEDLVKSIRFFVGQLR